jgi:hypothetical protein
MKNKDLTGGEMKAFVIFIISFLLMVVAFCLGDCTIEPVIGAIGVIRCNK